MLEAKSEWSHQSIHANGVRLHYVTDGEGPLMLFLHGFPENWYSWRHQIREFSKTHRVVALDLRGYNDSDKPAGIFSYLTSEILKDVESVIRGLGYKSCILVGHDLGGSIAWSFAYDYPGMVSCLIVLNAPHLALFMDKLRNPQQLARSWYIFFFQLPWLPELALRACDYRIITGMFSGLAVNKQAFTQEDLNVFKNAAAKPGALTAMLSYYRTILFSRIVRRKILEVSTILIWGENDPLLGNDLTYLTERYVRDFEIKMISNCSHWVQQEQPELVNEIIRNFIYEKIKTGDLSNPETIP